MAVAPLVVGMATAAAHGCQALKRGAQLPPTQQALARRPARISYFGKSIELHKTRAKSRRGNELVRVKKKEKNNARTTRMSFDTIIRGGTVATASDTFRCDIGISGG